MTYRRFSVYTLTLLFPALQSLGACSPADGGAAGSGGSGNSAGSGGSAGTVGGAAGSTGGAGAGATGGSGGGMGGSSGAAGSAGSSGGAGSGGMAGSAGQGGAGAGGVAGTAGAGGMGGAAGSAGGGAGGTSGTRMCTPGGTGFDTETEGVAIDLKTCLEWQRVAPPKQPPNCAVSTDNPEGLCWVEAGNNCKALNLDGQQDWRLPTVEELTSIVVAANYPAIDNTVFPNTELSMYWTSEADTVNHKATCLDFSNAGMANKVIGQTGGQAYRCVRGPIMP